MTQPRSQSYFKQAFISGLNCLLLLAATVCLCFFVRNPSPVETKYREQSRIPKSDHTPAIVAETARIDTPIETTAPKFQDHAIEGLRMPPAVESDGIDPQRYIAILEVYSQDPSSVLPELLKIYEEAKDSKGYWAAAIGSIYLDELRDVEKGLDWIERAITQNADDMNLLDRVAQLYVERREPWRFKSLLNEVKDPLRHRLLEAKYAASFGDAKQAHSLLTEVPEDELDLASQNWLKRYRAIEL